MRLHHNPANAEPEQLGARTFRLETAAANERVICLPIGGNVIRRSYVSTSASTTSMVLMIRTLSDKTFPITLKPMDAVDVAKMAIREHEGIPEDQQRLIWKGRQLEDGRLLCEYGVKTGDCLHLVLRMRSC